METIIKEWGLDASLHSKEEILTALSTRIGEMLRHDPMAFIQLMYRLDIPEGYLDAAMDTANVGDSIAMLIWERQIQKQLLRKSTPPPAMDVDEDLLW